MARAVPTNIVEQRRSVPDPVDAQVGVTIRSLRKERQMSQAALGAVLGVTFQQIQKYERGVNRVSASMLVHMATALGVQPADLLPRPEIPGPAPSQTAILGSVRGADELLSAYAAIGSRARRRAVLVMVRALGADPSQADAEREIED